MQLSPQKLDITGKTRPLLPGWGRFDVKAAAAIRSAPAVQPVQLGANHPFSWFQARLSLARAAQIRHQSRELAPDSREEG
ncbi:hypothetical protein RA26_02625 [Leisingera sp. ANG-M7]|nr:hypothetical protein RA26_02625 [Leisingera sp. ANG-M7]